MDSNQSSPNSRTQMPSSISRATKSFYEYMKQSGGQAVTVTQIGNETGIPKRRIYDIVIVLQILGLIEDRGRNMISANLEQMRLMDDHVRGTSATVAELEQELEDLQKSRAKLESEIEEDAAQRQALCSTQEFYSALGTITEAQLRSVHELRDGNLIIVRAPPGTELRALVEDGKFLKGEKGHEICFVSNSGQIDFTVCSGVRQTDVAHSDEQHLQSAPYGNPEMQPFHGSIRLQSPVRTGDCVSRQESTFNKDSDNSAGDANDEQSSTNRSASDSFLDSLFQLASEGKTSLYED